MRNLHLSLRTPFLLLLFVLTLASSPVVGAQTTTTAEPTEPLRTINTSGTGRVTATPDAVSISLGIESRQETLKPAQDEVTTSADKIMAMLKEQGIAEKDIETAYYNINPVIKYDRNGNYVGIEAYEVQMLIIVTVRDLENSGTILDLAVDNGANYIGGIYTFVTNPDPYIEQARTAAIEDARGKAETYATGAGVTITGLLTLDETSSPMPQAEDAAYAADAAAPTAGSERAEVSPVPVSAGETEIVVTIYTVWTVEPNAD